jgi:hypothetical protein
MKVKDVDAAWKYWTENNVEVIGKPLTDPAGKKSFFVRDPVRQPFILSAPPTGS